MDLLTRGKISTIDATLKKLSVDFRLNLEVFEFHFGEQVHSFLNLALFAQRGDLVKVRFFIQNLRVFGIFLKISEMGFGQFFRFEVFGKREVWWVCTGSKRKRSHA